MTEPELVKRGRGGKRDSNGKAPPPPPVDEPPALTPVAKLTRDIRDSAKLLDAHQARFLVDAYYSMQDDRIRAAHQLRTLVAGGEPNTIIEWLQDQTETLEESVKRALDAYSTSRIDGKWLRSICGIGPVISAGLMAHIDITQAPTVGHIWRFAGLDPTLKWEPKTKRPWNAALKRLCWIVGESFTKVSGLDSDVYGKVYVARKAQEIANNDAGKFADQAAAALVAKSYGEDTGARKWYGGEYPAGACAKIAALDTAKRDALLKKMRVEPGRGVPMLPPARIHLRAQRYAVKLFLSAYHEVLFFSTNGELPPKPYAVEHLGHAHYAGVPNMELVPGLSAARAKVGRTSRKK